MQDFRKNLGLAKQGKVLKDFECRNGYYLLSMDESGYFESKNIHCEKFCKKNNGSITYFYQLLGAVMVGPNQKKPYSFVQNL